MSWIEWWRDLLEVVEPEILEPDCLLCTGKAVPHGGTLLGLDVCLRCAPQHHLALLSYDTAGLVSRDAMRWAVGIVRLRNEDPLLKLQPVRVVTRLALAKLMGLEVDLADLGEEKPPLELDMHCGMQRLVEC